MEKSNCDAHGEYHYTRECRICPSCGFSPLLTRDGLCEIERDGDSVKICDMQGGTVAMIRFW